jgi:hypothetical protein
MRKHSSNKIPGADEASHAPARGEHCLIVLTEAELARVAAAGSKPGVSSGTGVKMYQ